MPDFPALFQQTVNYAKNRSSQTNLVMFRIEMAYPNRGDFQNPSFNRTFVLAKTAAEKNQYFAP